MTEEKLNELFEKSKDDRAIIVGSEFRELIAEVRRLRDHNKELQISMDKIEGRNFKLHRDAHEFKKFGKFLDEGLDEENQSLKDLLREAKVAIDAYIVCMRLGPQLVDFEMAQRHGLETKDRIDSALGEK